MTDLSWYDREEIGEQGKFDPLPIGEYVGVVASIEETRTKKSEERNDDLNRLFKCCIEVIEGDCKGRKVWCQFNIHNESEAAQRIGRQAFAAMCDAIGVKQPRNLTDVLDKPLRFAVKHETYQGETKDRVDERGFAPVSGNAVQTAPQRDPNAKPSFLQR